MGKTNFKMPLDLETAAAALDDTLRERKVQLVITMPEGSFNPELEDNVGNNPIVQVFLVHSALATALWNLMGVMPEMDMDGFVDDLIQMTKDELKIGGDKK